jgi:hypothetical protein
VIGVVVSDEWTPIEGRFSGADFADDDVVVSARVGVVECAADPGGRGLDDGAKHG